MKKYLIFLSAIPLLLASCSREPVANFDASDTSIGIGDIVYFTNRSFDADSYEWDFGDGTGSTAYNASHIYDLDGIYRVALKAYYKSHVDIAYLNITVVDASIVITVEEYAEPYYKVSGISVRLYASLQAWENPDDYDFVQDKSTDANGVVRFDHLGHQRYYADIWGPNHDNYKLAEEDVGWIETPMLIPGTISYWTAVVDYYPDGKKAFISRMELREIRKIEAAGGAQRKAADRISK